MSYAFESLQVECYRCPRASCTKDSRQQVRKKSALVSVPRVLLLSKVRPPPSAPANTGRETRSTRANGAIRRSPPGRRMSETPLVSPHHVVLNSPSPPQKAIATKGAVSPTWVQTNTRAAFHSKVHVKPPERPLAQSLGVDPECIHDDHDLPPHPFLETIIIIVVVITHSSIHPSLPGTGGVPRRGKTEIAPRHRKREGAPTSLISAVSHLVSVATGGA
jgi:hypothetical protein